MTPITDIINKVDSSKIINDFIKFATKELGNVKIQDIFEKVNKSNKVRKFLLEANSAKFRPGSDDFLVCIHSSINFTFAKAETIAVASIVLLERWNNSVNLPNQIADQDYLRDIVFRILSKCDGYKVHFDVVPNFFERFYKYIEKGFIKVVEDKTDPYYWIIVALEAVSFYKIGFDNSRPAWDEFTYNTFILNCSLIYSWKFPDELDQIGWDNTIPEKNLFNELVLKIALDFIDKKVKATKRPIGVEIFEDKDDMDACLKFFAIAIMRFCKRHDVESFRLIAYNVYETLIVKEFQYEKQANDSQMNDLAIKFSKAVDYLSDKLI